MLTKYRFPLLLVILAVSSCTPKKDWARKAIAEKEDALEKKSKQGLVDSLGVISLLKDYEDYAKNYPDDTFGAGYLFKAADFYRYLRKPHKSIDLYAHVYNTYGTSYRRPYALFMEGFIYENDLGNLDSARAVYQEFLQVFPDHAIAKDVKTSIENLGKTPEQLITEFEQRQKQDSLAKAQ